MEAPFDSLAAIPAADNQKMTLGRAWSRFRAFATDQSPPPAASAHLERVLYGFAQPVLGLRLLLRHPDLLKQALLPAVLLAAVCSVVAVVSPQLGDAPLWMRRAQTFYKTFAGLSVVPPILFARHYARLAARARERLGFGACDARIEALPTSIRRVVAMAILVAAGAAPVVWFFGRMPFAGKLLGQGIVALWGLHWIVVEALDDARVLRPGQSIRAAEREADYAPQPWFVRWAEIAADRVESYDFPLVSRPLAWFGHTYARIAGNLAKAWREEIAVAEAHPFIITGFGLCTAALLAAPVLNLLFRPIIILASTHVLGQLEPHTPALEQAHRDHLAGGVRPELGSGRLLKAREARRKQSR